MPDLAPTAVPTAPLPRRARRDAILLAAAGAFAHTGYAATSMDDIAAASGVTKLIVYRHFDSKEALYRAVLEQVFLRQADLFRATIGEGLQAEASIRVVLTAAREYPDAFRLCWRHAAREPQFADYAGRLRDIAVSAIRDVFVALLAAPYAEWAAQTVYDHVVDAVLNWLDHGDPQHDDRFVALETDAIHATVTAWATRTP